MNETREMHESNGIFQMLVGKTVSGVEYVDDYGEGITLRFADGSSITVTERMQAGQLEVSAIVLFEEI
jgi:hypothetical protein